MYKTGIGFMLLGVLLLIVAEKDILSIVISFFEVLFMQNFNAPLFGSLSFRLMMMLAGAIALLAGGLIYKKHNKG